MFTSRRPFLALLAYVAVMILIPLAAEARVIRGEVEYTKADTRRSRGKQLKISVVAMAAVSMKANGYCWYYQLPQPEEVAFKTNLRVSVALAMTSEEAVSTTLIQAGSVSGKAAASSIQTCKIFDSPVRVSVGDFVTAIFKPKGGAKIRNGAVVSGIELIGGSQPIVEFVSLEVRNVVTERSPLEVQARVVNAPVDSVLVAFIYRKGRDVFGGGSFGWTRGPENHLVDGIYASCLSAGRIDTIRVALTPVDSSRVEDFYAWTDVDVSDRGYVCS